MKKILLYIFCLACSAPVVAQTDSLQHVESGRQNSLAQQQKPYVIMISADGFRYDFADKYKAENLKQFRSQGVAATSLLPSFPSKTFPNHYTLVTGMYPATHGLINNAFYDPQRKEAYSTRSRDKVEDGSWYGGVPLWVLAEQQQMLTASFYWVGSEAPVQGVHPTYWYTYNESIPFESRVQTVVEWLQLPEEKRPHLITLYIPDIDQVGHRYGPDAPETREAVLKLDEQLKLLTDAVSKTGLPVNYIFVSDHGITQIDIDNTLPMPLAIDTAAFRVSGDGMVVELHAKNQTKRTVKNTYRQLKKEAKGNYKVYTRNNLPKHLRYGKKDDVFKRVGDIVLLTDAPKVFNFSTRKPSPGNHGFDPAVTKDMHAVFYAWGPAFKKNLNILTFQNIHVYPVITKILGLPFEHEIDGDDRVAEQILK